MNKLIPYIAVLLLGMVAGGWLCREYHFRDLTKIVQVDTVEVRDTIEIEKPIVKETVKTEKIYVEVRDTVTIHDTTYVVLQRESKTYEGEDYYAEVSGYKPSLDYIEVYPKTTTITTTETIKKKAKKHHIGIGIETNYTTAINIPVQVQYSYDIFPWLSVYGYGEYELLRKQFGVGAGTQIDIGL